MNCPACGSVTPPGAATCPACGSPLGTQTLPPGTVLGGKYRLDRVLGQGGFGITYAATQLQLGARVAIKELFPAGTLRHGQTVRPPVTLNLAAWEQAKRDFTEEGRILARFSHPDIVRVMDLFEEAGTAYLVMEFLEGETLGSRIERGGALPPGEVEAMARRVLGALGLVHGAGLLHRDLKPDNILLEKGGRVVLIDFGAARGYAQGQTVSHTRLVTPGYAPLEQYGTAARFGPYTDIYALGATLHHALTGQAPPPATDRMLGMPLPPLPAGTPLGLRRAIERSLEVKVTDRPQTTAEVLSLLAPAPVPGPTPPKPAPSGPPPPAPLPPVPVRKRIAVWPWVLAALLAGGGYAVLGGGWGGFGGEETSARSDEAAAGTVMPDEEKEKTAPAFPVMTTALNLHLRAAPTQSAASLAVLPGGTLLQVTREQSGWYEVNHGGQTGWVSAGFTLPVVGEDALAELLAVAAAGGELTLERGVYLLDAPLTLNAETSLIGAGRDQTWIVSSAGDTVVTSRGVEVRYQGLSVLWSGRSPGRVLLAEGGRVILRDVRLSGAVRDEKANLYGSGLWLAQGARGDLQGSYLTGNGYGLYLSEDSEVNVVSTGLSDNTLAGAIFLDSSGGRIAGSSFDRNGVHGVMVMDQAAPVLAGNQMRDNRQRGITVHGSAAPTLEDNTAQGNGFQGIGVQDDARPTVTGNTLRANKQSGLAYFGRGGGSASGNVIENNRTGVAMMDAAAPTLSGNTIRGNADAGVTFAGRAAGTLTENVIEANARPGVSAWGDARPTLTGNTIRNNKQSGIVLAERAGGTWRGNEVRGNALNGIVVTDDAAPELLENVFAGNGRVGILYKRGAAGLAVANTCTGNGSDVIGLELTGDGPDLTAAGCEVPYASTAAASLQDAEELTPSIGESGTDSLSDGWSGDGAGSPSDDPLPEESLDMDDVSMGDW
ncbi:hypothetical protein RDMS_08085 [Deinococcus sp. RL]|uniref:right-handed parallel beta-helix repeat-containing protein n=1 Tax=Deinococcus sp. RL TaxID=1489678 RepID=UPI0004DA27BD|nr:NosD domain-containing protein [Deinococcus sp. RL]KEF34348.1 hypothetical protein RDMS_08085 [Deinococcus sp. RL]